MKRILITVLAFTVVAWAQDAAKFEYIGTNKCKGCHNSAKKGAQYKSWEESAHAGAFETLKSEKSAEIAKKMGLKTAAYDAPECLVCHSTGFGKGGYEVKDAKFWNPAEDDKDGAKAVKVMENLQHVGCESCHGAGSEYKSKNAMEGVFDGSRKAAELGLLAPDEALCKTCHNEKSPTFNKEKPFIFAEKIKQITHLYPEDVKKELLNKDK